MCRSNSDKRRSQMAEKVGIEPHDRRTAKRGQGMLSACLICGDDGQVADCVLLNISAIGAKVSSSDGEHIDLTSGQRLMIAPFIDFPVEVIWQDGPVVGLRFLNDPQEVAAVLKERLPECGPFDGAEAKTASSSPGSSL